MCELTSNLSKIKTGCKVLAMKDGKFYSTFTGQELKTGKVPLPPTYAHKLCSSWGVYTYEPFKNQWVYNSSFAGKTAAYLNKKHAELILYRLNLSGKKNSEYQYIIAKISFRNVVVMGKHGCFNVIAGDTIRSISMIKQ